MNDKGFLISVDDRGGNVDMRENEVNYCETELTKVLEKQKAEISKLREEQRHFEIAFSQVCQKYMVALNEKKNLELEIQKKHALEQELQNTKQLLEFVKNTRSYKITAPLRAITRFLRRWIKL